MPAPTTGATMTRKAKRMPKMAPRITAFTVNSGISCSAGTKGLNSATGFFSATTGAPWAKAGLLFCEVRRMVAQGEGCPCASVAVRARPC